MPKLTFEQEDWLDRKFLEYFPYVSKYYPVKIFIKYLRFAKKGRLFVLPAHLQFKSRWNSTISLMEFNVPEMLSHEPFLSLIKRSNSLGILQADLRVLRKEIKKRTFNIFEFLICEEEALFLNEFQKIHRHAGNYSEDIPQLFFYRLDENGILGEYDLRKRCFIWDFSSISPHKPKNIYDAYRFFAHKIYNLRSFGIVEGITAKNYIQLNTELFSYLKKNIPLASIILTGDYKKLKLKKTYNLEIINEENPKGSLVVAFAELVNKELEGVETTRKLVGKVNKKIKKDIHIPKNTKVLISCINEQCKKVKRLLELYLKGSLSDFSEGNKTTIRKKYKNIYKNIKPYLLSEKSLAKFESAGGPKLKVDAHERLLAIKELMRDPYNVIFLKDPSIQKILTKPFIDLVNSYNLRNPQSMDVKLFDSDGDKYSPHERENNSMFYNEVSVEDKTINEIIIAGIKDQSPEESINKFIFYINKIGKELDFKPRSFIDKIQNEKNIKYNIDKIFDYYLTLHGPIPPNRCSIIKKLFKKIIMGNFT